MHRVSSITLALLGIAAAGEALAAPAPTTQDRITPPDAVFGVKPGSDYYLADYTTITKWLQTVAGESSRMKLVSLGKTAEITHDFEIVEA